MNLLLRFILVTILFLQVASGVSDNFYKEKFDTTKKLYLNAVMDNNSQKEIEYLKKLVYYGKKLQIDTVKYQRELNRLDKTTIVSKPIQTQFSYKSKYTIRSVKTLGNSIIIDFYDNIDKSFIDFNERKTKYNYYDSFDIKGNFKDASPTKLTIQSIDKITVVQKDSKTLNITLRDQNNPNTIHIINKKRIIIKVLNNNTKSDIKRQQKAQQIKNDVKMIEPNTLYQNSKIIVIDPGHGGKDAGAVGAKGYYEKDVVLNIAKYTQRYLQNKGFKVYLTRASDKYVKLSHRTHYANEKKADIFISIHANAARKNRVNDAHGIETYFLSPARSERAKRVAALENKGDMDNMGWSSKNSLLTILNRSKIVASNKMAIDIQRNMLYNLRNQYGENEIKDGGVREGPFWVLVGAQMPAVLVEVGYISHPSEKQRMKTKTYQRIIAKGIADGIESYFSKNF